MHALEATTRQTSDVVIIATAGAMTSAAGEPALGTGPAYHTITEQFLTTNPNECGTVGGFKVGGDPAGYVQL